MHQHLRKNPNAQWTVGLVQINNSFDGAEYVPYTVGTLQAYFQKHGKFAHMYDFMPPIFRRERVEEAVEYLKDADIVFFSLYTWNKKLSFAIAKELKALNSKILIVIGGPEVPNDEDAARWTLKALPFIDVFVHGEGERTFTQILEVIDDRAWSGVQGISWIQSKSGDVAAGLDSDSTEHPWEYRRNPAGARLMDLSTIPSPYLAGVFDELMEQYPDTSWIALWETNRGCPFSCTFCDWGSLTKAKVSRFDEDRLYADIDWFAAHEIEFVYCCDANFGILPRDVGITKRIAEVAYKECYPKSFSVQNTKNATERSYTIQKILTDSGLQKGVTLGMQSLDAQTLEDIERSNISLDTYFELQKRFTSEGVPTYIDLILGLPGETYDSWRDGICELIERGQHNRIQFNNLTILENSKMGSVEYQHDHGMQTVEIPVDNIHGVSIDPERADTVETQVLVTATKTMPEGNWIRARAFAWWVAFLHFDKTMQIPLVVTHELTGVSYQYLFNQFMNADPVKYPTLSWIRDFFHQAAENLSKGESEYVGFTVYRNMNWPMDEYVLIELQESAKLSKFYAEASALFDEMFEFDRLFESQTETERMAIIEAVDMNRALLKTPFPSESGQITHWTNVMSVYEGAVRSQHVPLKEDFVGYRVDTSEVYQDPDEWMKKVIWWQNKVGGYLRDYMYTARNTETEKGMAVSLP